MLGQNEKEQTASVFSFCNQSSFNPKLIRNELLHEIFEATVKLKPNNIALICGDQNLSYAELDARANQLAHYLHIHGVRKGTFVGIYLPRGIDIYISLLAILKAGGAYLPFSPDFPIDRVTYGLKDAGSIGLITHTDLIDDESQLPAKVFCINKLNTMLDQQPNIHLSRGMTQLNPTDSAYAICTSGTTGRPKCVEVSHRSVCHLVRAENSLLKVVEEDIYYQGFSLAFDASIEEIWIAFMVGATLFVGTNDVVYAGTEFASILSCAKVTVISCVPTLLSMVEDDIPTIRLINFVGESCPPELVKRWYHPGRQIFNTYGPTEATVTATAAKLHPDHPITIGRPLPNYTTYILDEKMQPVAPGESGELYIGGVGVAKGYIGKPELTLQKFVPNPFFKREMQNPVLYKTGDLTRFTPDGEIEFLGRIDTQIKLRGFRIELAEIEATLIEHADIKTAVVILHKDKKGIDQLVAYVVMREGKEFQFEKLRTHVAQRLPTYMRPNIIQPLKNLPVLASGKVDRKKLPEPEMLQLTENIVPPKNQTEELLVKLWQSVIPNLTISTDHDFFMDLGGHSLLAANVITLLRKIPEYRHVSMLDIYNHPTIQSFAASINESRPEITETKITPKECYEAPRWKYFTCALAQGVTSFFIFSTYALLGLFGPYIIYHVMVGLFYTRLTSALVALASFLLIIPISFVLALLSKWLVIGRYKPGIYPLWGGYYFRWWFVARMTALTPTSYMTGSPSLNFYFRLLGANIGRQVYLGECNLDDYDLIHIDDGASISKGTLFETAKVEGGFLKLGTINIGKNCYVGTSCILGRETVMEDGSELENLTLLPPGTTVPQGEIWAGSPAQKSAGKQIQDDQSSPVSFLRRTCFGFLQSCMIVLFPIFTMIPLFPTMGLMYFLNPTFESSLYIVYSPVFACFYIAIFCVEITALKWLLLGRVQPGTYSIYSWFYLRKWTFDQLMESGLGLLHSFYSTLFMIPWYRSLGVKMGKLAEISAATTICPDMIELGDQCFIADGVYLGVQRVHHGKVVIARTQLGNHTFIGNSAVLSSGTKMGDRILIGCLSVPPENKDAMRDDTSWFGSPCMHIPRRQQFANFKDDVTYDPPKKLILQRLFFEFFRVIFPMTCYTSLLVIIIAIILTMDFEYHYSLWTISLFFPLFSLGFGVSMVLIALAAKWLLIGRYKADQQPLWSHFVWRTEFVTAVYESLAVPFFLEPLSGTPYINWVLSLFGCKMGKQVFTNTTDITEFDLVKVGDYAELNLYCDLQTHLFEDRVMKMSSIYIGKHCTVGSLSVVLYDTVMEEGSELESLSVLMKGETLPANTQWIGSPARTTGLCRR